MGTSIQNKLDIQNTVTISSGNSKSTQKGANSNEASAFDNSLNDAVGNSRSNSGITAAYSKKQLSSVNTRTTKNASDISSADSKKNSVKNTKKFDQDDSEKIADDAGTQMVEEIAEELDVSTEDVEKAMELLGMSSADLFDSDRLTQLVAQITGETDSIGIITDESLYSGLRNIISSSDDILQSISEQLGLTTEQLKDLLADAASNKNVSSAEVQSVTDFVPDGQNAVDQNASAKAGDVSGDQEIASQEQLNQSSQNTQNEHNILGSGNAKIQDNPKNQDEAQQGKQVIVETDQENQNKAMQLNAEESSNEEAGTGTGIQNSARENAGKNGRNGSDTDSSLFQKSFIEQIMGKSTGNNPTVEFQNIQTTATTEDMTTVIDQITDYMKIHMKQDMTSMEIQLHPQSLGNVNVIVSEAKNGQIVAQFTTQNESVKTAIENQMPMLQQQFEEQGIKVDAVSVTVDNHQMNSSLDNGKGQQPSDTGEAKSAIPHRKIRQIDLNSLEDDGTDDRIIDDESRITAQMMAVNGNTVDYTV